MFKNKYTLLYNTIVGILAIGVGVFLINIFLEKSLENSTGTNDEPVNKINEQSSRNHLSLFAITKSVFNQIEIGDTISFLDYRFKPDPEGYSTDKRYLGHGKVNGKPFMDGTYVIVVSTWFEYPPIRNDGKVEIEITKILRNGKEVPLIKNNRNKNK